MKTYLLVLVSLVGADMVWLNFAAKAFYQKHLGYIFAEKFVLWPAVIFYLLYAFGVVYFVVNPALEARSLSLAIFRGALLGLLAYGAYDLTNHATLAKWPLVITISDLAWGVFVTAFASTVAYVILK